MRIKLSSAAIAVALLAATSASAQTAQSGFAFEANVAQVFEVTGGELGVGYNFATEHFRVTPMVGAFIYQGENDEYSYDSNVDRCRDSRGRFARDELCNDLAAEAYGKIEAAFVLNKFEIGGGYRVAEEDSMPYGTIAFAFGTGVALKAQGGSDFVGVGLTFRR